RATLESLAYQSRDALDTMVKDSGVELPTMREDGGAANNDYLMQFQADILGTTIERAEMMETTALGAAYVAGLATRFWKDIDEVKKYWVIDVTFEPEKSQEVCDDLYED